MLLKELILNSLESFDSFILDNKPLTAKLYEQFADYEVKNYYLDIDKAKNQPIIVITLE